MLLGTGRGIQAQAGSEAQARRRSDRDEGTCRLWRETRGKERQAEAGKGFHALSFKQRHVGDSRQAQAIRHMKAQAGRVWKAQAVRGRNRHVEAESGRSAQTAKRRHAHAFRDS